MPTTVDIALHWSVVFIALSFGLILASIAWAVVYHHITLRRYYAAYKAEADEDGDRQPSPTET